MWRASSKEGLALIDLLRMEADDRDKVFDIDLAERVWPGWLHGEPSAATRGLPGECGAAAALQAAAREGAGSAVVTWQPARPGVPYLSRVRQPCS